MRWAVIGDQGMLGREIANFLVKRGHEVLGLNRNNLTLGEEPSELENQIPSCEIWVNCIANTDVDEAETESLTANLVNGVYAGTLAKAAKLAGARFIHISTDYVFDGVGPAPFRVSDEPNPQTAYGKSKVLGEKLIAESGADYSILRTAWLYGEFGNCFPKAIAKKLKSEGSALVVNDQFGQPTWTRDLAEIVFQVAQLKEMPRIVHATSTGETSWAEFAKEIAASIGFDHPAIEEIRSSALNTPAKRPAWSVLDNSSDVIDQIGAWRERWRVAAPFVLREFLA